jgi:ATP phosphoribosyltransferase
LHFSSQRAETGPLPSAPHPAGHLFCLVARYVLLANAAPLESGDTMRAAGLHAIHTLMSSEAVLITSRTPHPAVTPELAPLVPLIKSRFAGVLAAKRYVYTSYNVRRDRLQGALRITPGRRAATVSPLDEEGWVAVSAMVERKSLAKTMDDLEAAGAEDVLTFALDNCRVGV